MSAQNTNMSARLQELQAEQMALSIQLVSATPERRQELIKAIMLNSNAMVAHSLQTRSLILESASGGGPTGTGNANLDKEVAHMAAGDLHANTHEAGFSVHPHYVPPPPGKEVMKLVETTDQSEVANEADALRLPGDYQDCLYFCCRGTRAGCEQFWCASKMYGGDMNYDTALCRCCCYLPMLPCLTFADFFCGLVCAPLCVAGSLVGCPCVIPDEQSRKYFGEKTVVFRHDQFPAPSTFQANWQEPLPRHMAHYLDAEWQACDCRSARVLAYERCFYSTYWGYALGSSAAAVALSVCCLVAVGACAGGGSGDIPAPGGRRDHHHRY